MVEQSFSCEQELLKSNIALNSTLLKASGGLAVAFPLVWGETDCSKLEQQWAKPDLIVAADVIYHRELMDPLLETVKALGESLHNAGGLCSILLISLSDQSAQQWLQGPKLAGRGLETFKYVHQPKLSVLKDRHSNHLGVPSSTTSNSVKSSQKRFQNTQKLYK